MKQEIQRVAGAGALGVMVLVAGCSRTSNDGPSTTSSPGSSTQPRKPANAPTVTIQQGKDGRTSVDGAPLHGDPKVCAAFKKCCAAPPSGDFGLMCGMAQAEANGDCAKALASVRAYARERRLSVCK